MSEIKVGKVAMVPFSSIQVGERARKEMGDLDGMEESIKDRGLIQPLAVKELGNNTFILLAGERRYRVLERNEVDTVPVRVFPNSITNIEMKSIEVAENFYRKDMEYWEHDQLISEIHALQQELHGKRFPGPNQEGWTQQDTGNLIGITDASVNTAIKRANAREAFPELFEKCKTQKDASTLVKKMDEMMVKQVIAQKLENSKSENSFSQLAKRYIVGSFFDGIKKIPDDVYHLVEIDPPYAIGIKEAKKSSGESRYSMSEYNEIPKSKFMDSDPSINWEGMNEVFKQCYRVMTAHSWMIVWFGPEPWFNDIYKAIIKAGFETTRMCGIWTKPTGQSKRPEIHLANSYEMFFYAWKGRPALNKQGRRNIFDIPPVPNQQKVHPTERPVQLMREIYDTFAFQGSRVLIPFLGSGNGILAADQLGMEGLGFDLSKAHRDSFLVKLHGMKEG
jgi:DNA modification methylase/ParB-like chromosome segregation protein Spo0J